jgi:hypothetical protein
MLLGTEILVALRHAEKFKTWYYLADVLCSYGACPSSGTIKAATIGDSEMAKLAAGYALARAQGKRPAPESYAPKIILTYSEFAPKDDEQAKRNAAAEESWQFHFGNADVIELPVFESDLPRSGRDMGDKDVPFVRDIFDFAVSRAMPEDIVAYINRDIGLTSHSPERLLAGVERGNGVTVCPRRGLFPSGRLYKSVRNHKHDGGFDIMAFTLAWWENNREAMPDMLIGREAWDTVFRTIAEEWADDRQLIDHVSDSPKDWNKSKAYTDDVCWHWPHDSEWDAGRTTLPGQIHNRELAIKFFEARKNIGLVQLIKSYGNSRPVPIPQGTGGPNIPTRRPVPPRPVAKPSPYQSTAKPKSPWTPEYRNAQEVKQRQPNPVPLGPPPYSNTAAYVPPSTAPKTMAELQAELVANFGKRK